MSILQQSKVTGFLATVKPDAAKDFYANVLGLTLTGESQYALVFDSNGTMVRIQKVKEFSPQPFTALGWNVTDIETAVAELTSHGVKMVKTEFVQQDPLGIWTTPDGSRVAWFLDPDGNTLSLAQMNS
jgi:predicted enzyme related to lactoylglutathione lyase